jgi:uridylate kinase
MEEVIIISLGGSMIVPEEIDVEFLKEFKGLISAQVAKGKKFIIVAGGGRTCRKYQAAAKAIVNASKEDQDWIGIATCNLNADFLRVIFAETAYRKVFYNPNDEGLKGAVKERPVVIGGVLEPGHSSDFDAVMVAETVGAKKIINLSNIDHVYDSDPKENPDAKKFETISWEEYRNLIPKEWTSAGLSTPFDPIASKAAQETGIEVAVMNGKPLDNLEKYLNGEKFSGTVIS